MFKTHRGCPLWALKFQKKCSGAYDKKTRWTLSYASEFSEKCSNVFDKNVKKFLWELRKARCYDETPRVSHRIPGEC